MPLLVNLRHLDAHNLRLQGELPVQALDIDTRDEMIQMDQPLQHDLEVQKLSDSLLVQGRLRLVLECKCVRCLKPFQYPLEIKDWTCHLPLQGEERVVVTNDCVDLTPYVREDILLAFPQHPLCKPDCGGLPKTSVGRGKQTGKNGESEPVPSAWAALDKLKL